MSAETTKPAEETLTIDAEEQIELVTLLGHALGDTRVEVHHTHTPDFRDQVLHRETVIRRLLAKLQPKAK